MKKDKETEAQEPQEEPVPVPEPVAVVEGPLVRKGRYVGVSGRRFESYPFGGQLVPQSGEIYEVGEDFKYLWDDPQFAHLWEWDGEPYKKQV